MANISSERLSSIDHLCSIKRAPPGATSGDVTSTLDKWTAPSKDQPPSESEGRLG